MTEKEPKHAMLGEIKSYFDYEESKRFALDWKELSEEDKLFFKEEVYKVLHPNE